MANAKYGLVALIAAGVFLACVHSASALERDVSGGCNYTDTLAYDSDWNAYRISAQTQEKISWNVTVKGAGMVQVYFIQGWPEKFIDASYYPAYSKNYSVRSFGSSFDVNKEEGTKFTIGIHAKVTYNITYTIKVWTQGSSSDTTTPSASQPYDLVCGGLMALIVLCAVATTAWLYSVPKKYKAKSEILSKMYK